MIAIIGAVVIDGTGTAPRHDATVLLRGRYIEAIGPQREIHVPTGAAVIDGRGLFVLPGFIDAGVRIGRSTESEATRAGMVGGEADSARSDSLAAQRLAAAVRYGVTTVRVGGGKLPALQAVRDRLRAGQLNGARLLLSGPAIGTDEASAAGMGADLLIRDAEMLRYPIAQYLDRDVDFLVYPGTWGTDIASAISDRDTAQGHDVVPPAPMFSERAQRVILEEAHARGLSVDTYAAAPDGLRMVLQAGVDVVQHPEILRNQTVLSNELVELFVRRRVLCVLQPQVSATTRGSSAWQNAQRLIRGGCAIAVASGGAEPGLGTLRAIEGLVQLGMPPMTALVAATRHGARAANMTTQLGTIEAGKLADLVLLRADPLQDITHIERIAMVFAEGRRVFADNAAASVPGGAHGR